MEDKVAAQANMEGGRTVTSVLSAPGKAKSGQCERPSALLEVPGRCTRV